MKKEKYEETINSQTQNIIKHFSARAEKYDKSHDWVNDGNLLDILETNLPIESKKILDLGAGTGMVAKHILKKRGDKCELVAIDICQEMLDKIDEIHIKTVCSGVEDLPFENDTFDAVVSRQCLHYVGDVEKTINEVKRVLKSNGTFILAQIVPYNKDTSSDWRSVVQIRQPLRKWYFTSDEWNSIIEKHNFHMEFQQKYVRTASVGKWSKKYCRSNDVINQYKQELLSKNDYFKKIYEVYETNDDVIFCSYWHIAKYIKLE